MRYFIPIITTVGLLFQTAFATEIATVNGVSISDSDYRGAVKALGPSAGMVANNPGMRGRFLDHLIENQLLSEKAAAAKLGEADEFKMRLEHSKKQILAEMFAEHYIEERTTDVELERYFNANKKKFITDSVKASHIVVKNEKQAEEILKLAIVPGANFKALIEKFPTSPSGEKSGDLGWFGRGRMGPEFDAAAFAAKKGEVYPKVVKTQFGFHVLKVEDIRNEGNAKFQDERGAVKQLLSMSLRKELLESLRGAAKIEIKAEALKKLKF
jgi:peptidyl-prolyl cis-trans isomerase C